MTDDTSDIESMLGQFRPAGPDAAVRGRVVRHVRGRSLFAYWEAMAAMLLVGATLSQIGASATQMVSTQKIDEAHIRQMASAIARLDLPVTPDEAQAMALRLSAGEHLILLPLVHGDLSFYTNHGALP